MAEVLVGVWTVEGLVVAAKVAAAREAERVVRVVRAVEARGRGLEARAVGRGEGCWEAGTVEGGYRSIRGAGRAPLVAWPRGSA